MYNCLLYKTLSIISYVLPRVLVVGPPDDGSSSNSKPSTEFELLGGGARAAHPRDHRVRLPALRRLHAVEEMQLYLQLVEKSVQ